MTYADTATLASERDTLLRRAGLVDRSERGKLALTGAEAIEFLNGQITNELTDLRAGEGRYAAFLTHKGRMLGDLRVLAVGDERGAQPRELLLDTERVALQALFDMIRRFKVGYRVELHKRTVESAMLSLIGPQSLQIAGAEPVLGGADEHANTALEVDGVRALAVHTGVGVDLLCASEDGQALAEALAARGAQRVSDAAAECVRIERGVPRYGVDLDDSVIPQEAGLNERAVSFTKGCYVGQETVARLYYKGTPKRHLRGLLAPEPLAIGAGVALDGRELGTVTSAALAPALGPIGLALLRKQAAPGMVVQLSSGGEATVVELPFKEPGAAPG